MTKPVRSGGYAPDEHKMFRTLIVTGLSLTVVLGAVGAYRLATHPASEQAASPQTITVSRSNCGEGWTSPHEGVQSLRLHNAGITPAEVEIVETHTGAIFGEVEGLGPDDTRKMTVTLGSGDYAVRCVPEGIQAITGPAVHIPGDHVVAGGVRPVTKSDLLGPVASYHRLVSAGLTTFTTQTKALNSALSAGDLGAAKRACLAAHLQFERLGAAYDAFGDDGEPISPLPQGMPGGVHDKDFVGLRRIEYGLYHGESVASLRPLARQLNDDAEKLRTDFPDLQTDPADLGLRAHEILEDTGRFVLTGQADQGSGSELATVQANVDGTKTVLRALRPVLTGRYAGLSTMDAKVRKVETVLARLRGRNQSWPPLKELTRAQRQEVNAAVNDALEQLAPVAAICQQRRTS